MIVNNGAPTRARWQVIWVSDGRIVRKDYEHDLAEAVRIYGLAIKAGKRMATLRCCNEAFAPPDKYADREVVVVVKKSGRKVKAKRITNPRKYQATMAQVNSKGLTWCPFCMSMRKFRLKKSHRVEGVTLSDRMLVCPLCGVSHNHGSVVRYNPALAKIKASRRVPRA